MVYISVSSYTQWIALYFQGHCTLDMLFNISTRLIWLTLLLYTFSRLVPAFIYDTDSPYEKIYSFALFCHHFYHLVPINIHVTDSHMKSYMQELAFDWYGSPINPLLHGYFKNCQEIWFENFIIFVDQSLVLVIL